MRRGLILLALCSLATSTICRGTGITPQNFKIIRSAVSEQLSQQTIRQTFQDSSGLIWILTQEGLHRYDGYNLLTHVADSENPGSISHNNVRAMTEDHSGRLWLATIGGGLNYYDPSRSEFGNIRAGNDKFRTPQSDNISAIFTDHSGFIWLGYQEGDVAVFDPDGLTFRPISELSSPSVQSGQITGITEADSQRIIVTTSRGVLRVYDKRSREFETFNLDSSEIGGLRPNHITAVLVAPGEIIWCGTQNDGLVKLELASGLSSHYRHNPHERNSLISNATNSLALDKSGTLWIGTDSGLSMLSQSGQLQSFTNLNSGLADEYVQSITQDSHGTLWIGTNYGIYHGFSSAFESLTSKRGLPNESITSFAESEDGGIWVASFGGLFLLDQNDGSFRAAREKFHDFSLRDQRVMAVTTDHRYLWLGYRQAGVDRIHLGSHEVKALSLDSGDLLSNGVTSISIDSKNRAWVGTFGGGAAVVLPRNLSGERDDSIQRLAADGADFVYHTPELTDGKFLVASTKGLSIYQSDLTYLSRIRPLALRTTLHEQKDLQVLRAVEDKRGNIWLGLQYEGLALWSAENRAANRYVFEPVKTEPPMPSSTVYAIEEDDGGMLWISTPNGLIRLDPESRRIRNFDFSDGLQDDEFNFGASFKDSQGRLYFGGNRGFNRFDPADIPPTRGPPRLVFTQIEIAGRPVIEDVAYVPPDKVELAPDDYYATFQFSALDYTEPSRNRYQYKLENFDRRWVDIANRNTITFTSLPSGQYRLRVRAANAGGNWNNIGLTLPIDVLPNKYLTWWAFSIYGALLWAIGWLIKKSYDRWMLLENVRGEASVNFSVAERAMDDLQEYQETGRSLLRNLRKHNERLLALVPRLLNEPDYRRETGALPSSFKVSDTRLRCMLMLEHHLSYAGDILQIDLHGVIEELFEAYDDHMQRGELLISPINECTMAPLPERLALPCALIINELIHNSLSHAFEGLQGIQFVRVFFEETASKDGWTLIVQDSGTGNAEHFVPATDSGGGLQLVHELTLDLGGALTIDHQGGTTVRIDIPFSGDLC